MHIRLAVAKTQENQLWITIGVFVRISLFLKVLRTKKLLETSPKRANEL